MKKLCTAFFVFLQIQVAGAADLAIKNVTVISAGSIVPEQTVLITGDKIERVSSQDTGTAKQVIDGSGQFLIPGLWDMHVHIVYEPDLIDAMPGLFLDYGVTSVRDTGALLERIAPQVKRWEVMGSQAPGLYFSGPLLDGSLVVYDGKGRPEIGVQNASVEFALQNFARLQAAGVDFIKIYELVSPEVFMALVAAANEAKLPIAAHVPLAMTADTAGPLVGSMEHLRNIEISCATEARSLHESRQRQIKAPEQVTGYELRSHLHSSQRPVALANADPLSERCQAVIQSLQQTIQVPTLRLNTITNYSPLLRDDWRSSLQQLPTPVSKKWLETAEYYAGMKSPLGEQMSDWSLDLVAAMNDQGVPIGAGTDTPIGQAIPGYSLHTELERLVDAGLSPAQALIAATIRPAEFFGLEDRMGKVEAGMEADLVLLDANPLADIRNTRRIVNVIANGEVVR